MAQQLKRISSVQKGLKFFSAALALSLAAGCAKTVSFTPNPISNLPAGSLAMDWILPLSIGKDKVTTLDVRDDTIYVFTEGKQVFALNRKPGKGAGTLKFMTKIETPSPKLLPPVELKDHIIFPTTTTLELVDFHGEHARSVPLSAPLHSGATGSGNFIYFGAFDPHGGRLLAVNLSRDYSTTEWQLLTGGAILGAPVLFSGLLYVADEAGEVYAVNQERAPVWNIDKNIFMCGDAVVADLKADDQGLYIASKDSKLYCLNRTTGKLKWQYFAGNPLVDSPIPTSDTIYLTVPGQGLAAIDKNAPEFNRKPKWISSSATQFLSQDEKYVYLVLPKTDPDNEKITLHSIIAVNKQTGVTAFESQHQDFEVFGTNTKDSTIYCGYANGQILALKPIIKAGQIGSLVLQPVKNATIALAR